jgi:uncharacterized protein (TIGR03435 family)
MSTTLQRTSGRRGWLVGLAMLAAFQPASAQQKAFDVASVLVNKEPGRPGSTGTTMRVQSSGITFLEVSLMNCIAAAYGVTSYQIKGPGWLQTDWFDIVAKTAAPASRQQLMVMLQALLVDRFGLRLHRERAPIRAYALVADKRGPRLTPAADETGEKTPGTGAYRFGMTRAEKGWAFKSASMADLAEYLSNAGPIGVPVVDETKLAGRFDFTFALMPARAERNRDGGPTEYIDALAELGLTLHSRTIPMEILVVDHAERIPTPN